MLWEELQGTCTKLDKQTVSDGQGGFTTEYSESNSFKATIIKNSSIQTRIAEKQGITSLYTVTIPNDIKLEFHDIFKRNRDNKVFRVTSDYTDSKPPKSASFNFNQVTAEEWSL